MKELQADLVEYFCKGFGVGEIRLAFKYAAGSKYTAQMLLALRAQGAGWGELKKLAQANPKTDDNSGTTTKPSTSQNKQTTNQTKQTTTQNKQTTTTKNDKAPKTGKPDNPGKSSQHGKH